MPKVTSLFVADPDHCGRELLSCRAFRPSQSHLSHWLMTTITVMLQESISHESRDDMKHFDILGQLPLAMGWIQCMGNAVVSSIESSVTLPLLLALTLHREAPREAVTSSRSWQGAKPAGVRDNRHDCPVHLSVPRKCQEKWQRNRTLSASQNRDGFLHAQWSMVYR